MNAYDPLSSQVTGVVLDDKSRPELITFDLSNIAASLTVRMTADQLGNDSQIESLSLSSNKDVFALGRIVHDNKDIMIISTGTNQYSYIKDALRPKFSPDGQAVAYVRATPGEQMYSDSVFVKKLNEDQSVEVYNGNSSTLSKSTITISVSLVSLLVLYGIYAFKLKRIS